MIIKKKLKPETNTAKETTQGTRIWDSTKHFCDSTRVTRDAAKAMIKLNPKVKKFGRIYEAKLPPGWLEQHQGSQDDESDETKDALERRKLKAQISGIEKKNERLEEHYWHEDEVAELAWAIFGPIRQWCQSVEAEWPGLLPGMTADQVRLEVQRRVDELMQNARAVVEKIKIT